MATVTYYVALPFIRNEGGEIVAGEAQDRQSAGAAESAARRMAETAAGAVAFSRTGDPATGEFEDALVIREFGEVPTLDADEELSNWPACVHLNREPCLSAAD